MSNNRTNINYKYGICLNDECTKCKAKEVQQVPLRKEFVCSECGGELRECPPPKRKSYKLPIIIASAVVAVGCGVGGFLAFSGSGHEDKTTENSTIDTSTTITATEATTTEQDNQENTVTDEPVKKVTSTNYSGSATAGAKSGSTSLGWGTYSGPMQSGQPHGIGGTVKVTSNHSIDLKDGRGTMLEVEPGETIENTKFENGRLRSGELHRNDGTRKYFNC